MPTIDTPKGKLSYTIHGGHGPALVMLRGLGRTVRHWLGYETTMAREARVITLDLRGIGESKVPAAWTNSVFDLSDDIATVLDDAGIDKAHILGVSLGGMVTLAMGLRHPERCQSLIVVNTSIGGQREMRLTFNALRTVGTAFLKRDEKFHHHLVDVLVGSKCPPERKADVARQYEAIADVEGLYPWVILKQLVAAGRFLPKRALKSMQVPTLVVYGTDDRFVPNINSRKLVQHLPHAKLVPIADGGHELSVDKPEELARAVHDWIRELETTSSRQELPEG